MNSIKALYEYIVHAHPNAIVELSPPLRKEGVWFLDVHLGDKHLAIQWSPTTGFGVSSTSEESFGEGPDEVFATLENAQQRVGQLLTTGENTVPPITILLSRLRERRRITQQELARRLGVRQATISGLESREDFQLSTLKRVVEALGGVLEVFGHFPDSRYRIDIPSSESRHRRTSGGFQAYKPMRGVAFDENAFGGLREAGALPKALATASAISARHAVIEIP